MSDQTSGEPSRESQKLCKGLFRSFQLQINLLTIFLLVSASVVWIAERKTVWDTERLEAKLIPMRNIAREPIVDDPSRIAAVAQLPVEERTQGWNVYIPDSSEGQGFQLCLLLGQVPVNWEVDPGPPIESLRLSSGNHSIRFQYDADYLSVNVSVDGERAMFLTDQDQGAKGRFEFQSLSFASPAIKHVSESFDPREVLPLLYQKNLLLWIELES